MGDEGIGRSGDDRKVSTIPHTSPLFLRMKQAFANLPASGFDGLMRKKHVVRGNGLGVAEPDRVLRLKIGHKPHRTDARLILQNHGEHRMRASCARQMEQARGSVFSEQVNG
jgi:hypothetical protein